MASVVLSVGGGLLGGVLGGPLGAKIGASLGAAIGGMIDQSLFAPHVQGPRLSDLKVTSSAYGSVIPLIYGDQNRVSGNIIWSTGLVEKEENSGGKGGPSTTTYSYSTSIAILVCAGRAGNLKRVWANSKVIYDSAIAPTGKVYSSLTWYVGSETQNPDPTMEAHEGAGNVPAYRNTAYCVIAGLQLADYGNAMPNLEFEIEGYAPNGQVLTLVSDWVRDIARRANLSGLDITTSAIQAVGKGYSIGKDTTASAALEPLSLAYNFDLAEQYGQIRCIPRGQTITATVPIDEMGVSTSLPENLSSDPLRIDISPVLALPRATTISFADPSLDYQINSQSAFRQTGNAANNVSRELPLVLSVDEVRKLADLLLHDAWSSRRSTKFKVSDRWKTLYSASVFGITVGGEIAPFKVLRATRGMDGVIEIEARGADPEAYLSNAMGVSGRLMPNPLSQPGVTRLVLIDGPLLRDADDDSGFYWVVARQERGWRGAKIYRSTDAGADYAEMSSVGIATTIADVPDALPSGPVDYWDYGNTLVVQLYDENQSLQSLSEEAVLAGGNAAWLGDPDGQNGEIIQFKTATLMGYGIYELSGLLRGRKGTDYAVATHGADEVFVLLDSSTLGRSDFGAGDWDKERLFKPVSILTALVDTASQPFTNSGESKRPYSPVNPTGSRDGSNNLTITWTRRSRLSAPGLGYGPTPLGEETEAYEIDVLIGLTVVRTITATSETASYSAADQTTDGVTPGDPVSIEIYQLSASRGRGHGRSATV